MNESEFRKSTHHFRKLLILAKYHILYMYFVSLLLLLKKCTIVGDVGNPYINLAVVRPFAHQSVTFFLHIHSSAN